MGQLVFFWCEAGDGLREEVAGSVRVCVVGVCVCGEGRGCGCVHTKCVWVLCICKCVYTSLCMHAWQSLVETEHYFFIIPTSSQPVRYSYIYAVHMSPTVNRSSALEHFECLCINCAYRSAYQDVLCMYCA